MPSTLDFTRLQDLAGRIEEPAWRGFARYCDLRGRGLRAEAMAALAEFVAAAAGWPLVGRQAFVRWIAEARRGFDDGGVLVPVPLLARLIRPTLLEWTGEEPAGAEPHLLLGLLYDWAVDKGGSDVHFRNAIERDAGCELARLRLIDVLLGEVERAQHHLPDGYIGDPVADLRTLDEVDRLLGAVSDDLVRHRLAREAVALRRAAISALSDLA